MATPEASPRPETSAAARSCRSACVFEPPSDRGSSWRPCSATVTSSSWRKETFTGIFAYSQLRPGLEAQLGARLQQTGDPWCSCPFLGVPKRPTVDPGEEVPCG